MLFSTTLLSSLVVVASMASAAVLSHRDGEYETIFIGQFDAVEGDDFLTFHLVPTPDDCKAFCDSIPNCGFANSYHDNNGKGGATDLTCSLFVGCHDQNSLTNFGGQTQPDGTVNFITDSDGYCKIVSPPPVTTDPAPEPTGTDGTIASSTTDPVEATTRR